MTTRVKFGFMGRCFPPMDRALESMTGAEAQGWDFLSFPDQLPSTRPIGLKPDNAAPPDDDGCLVSAHSAIWYGSFELLSAAAVLTRDIELQMAVVDPLRRSPAVFAQEAVTISHLAKGRATWCIGSGEAKQFEPYGERRTKPAARLEEAIRVMHALWESGGKPISRESEFWPLADATFPLPLYNGEKPGILVVGGGPKLERLAGELCNGWMTFLPGGVTSVEDLKGIVDRIRGIASDAGRDAEALKFHALSLTVLAENDEVAWEYARKPALCWASCWTAGVASGEVWKSWGFEHPFGDDAAWPKNMKVGGPEADWSGLPDLVPEPVTDRTYIWGGPERVAESLAPYLEAGITHLQFDNAIPWADPAYAKTWGPLVSDVIVRLGGKPLALDR
jgi:phthiodiolone/phenolphthiodiolone dimycocerosates ketoreductase